MSLQRFLGQIRRGADGGSTSGDSSGEAGMKSSHVTPGRLEAELRRRAAVKQARGLLGEAGFAAAAEEMAREEAEAAKVARRNAALSRQRREALSAFVQAYHAGDPRRGLEAWLLDAGDVDDGATVSAAAQAQGLAAKYLGGLLADLQRADLIPELNYGHLDRRVVRALWDLEEDKKTGAAKARDRSARQTREASSVEPGTAAPSASEPPQQQQSDGPSVTAPAANGGSSKDTLRPDTARTEIGRDSATPTDTSRGGATRSGTAVIGPGEVAALSKILAKYDRAARLEAEAAGAWVKPLPGYVLRQSHDADRIRFAGFQAWRDFLAERLDERSFEGVTDRERYLRRVYDALSRGAQHLLLGAALRPIALDETGGDENGEGARAWMQAVARLLTNDRLLHFKSADAWFDYLERFGAGTLNEALLFGLERLGRTTGLMRALGPDLQGSLDGALQDLVADTKGRSKARQSLKTTLARLDGSVSLPAEGIAARVAAGVEAQRAFARLGGLMAGRITQAPDGAARLETRGRGLLFELERDLTNLIASRRTPTVRQELAAMLSVFHEAMARGILARAEAVDGYPGTAGRLLRYRLKLDGGVWWDESLRGAVAQAMSHRLARNKTRDFDALEPALQSELGFYEIGAEDWPALRKAARRLADGRDYVTPEALQGDMAKKLADYLTERSALALFEDAEAPRPLAPLSAIGTLLGGAELVLLRYSERFALFPLAASQNREGQAILRQGDNEVAKALTNGHGEILGLAQLLMWSALFGHGAKRAPEIAEELGEGSGEEGPRKRDDAAWRQAWRDAMTQGGGLGLYGDFLLDLVARRLDGRPLTALAGPVLKDSRIGDLPELARRLRNGEAAAADALSALLEREDFATVFFARFGLDNLFLQRVLEAALPGVRQRLARHAREAERQGFFFTPSRVG